MQEEYENYIEINEEITLHFHDWVYDTILNRTIKELEDDNLVDVIDYISEGKREVAGFLTILHLERRDFKTLYRYMKRAYEKSLYTRKIYNRKAHNQLLKQFRNLVEMFIKDERFGE